VDLSQNLIASDDVVLLASAQTQEQFVTALRKLGHAEKVFPCFRPGLKMFQSTTSAGNVIQLKAFLPMVIRESYRA
jgi:hypothetical protein